jgi:hypothetical protein
MIRRFYVLPLARGAEPTSIDQFQRALADADAYIDGLQDSSAGIDTQRNTMIWEMRFVDEDTYTGAYMVHPYHVDTLDRYLISDSPERIAHDIATMRYTCRAAGKPLMYGIRRIMLMNLDRESADAGAAILEGLAGRATGMRESVFSADDIAWNFPGKGSTWTHVWEQGFDDEASMEQFLRTADGTACSSVEGLKRLGVHVTTLDVYTYPFSVKPAQSPPALPADEAPVFYSLAMQVAPHDVQSVVESLEQHYDPAMQRGGAVLEHRRRSVDRASECVEVLSTWRLESMAAYAPLRVLTVTDPGVNAFVLRAMPLVLGGTRRFHREA